MKRARAATTRARPARVSMPAMESEGSRAKKAIAISRPRRRMRVRGAVKGAKAGRSHARREVRRPQIIRTSTKTEVRTVARIPTGWKMPKTRAIQGLVAVWAAREAESEEASFGGQRGTRR
jgi:hypothetical protein